MPRSSLSVSRRLSRLILPLALLCALAICVIPAATANAAGVSAQTTLDSPYAGQWVDNPADLADFTYFGTWGSPAASQSFIDGAACGYLPGGSLELATSGIQNASSSGDVTSYPAEPATTFQFSPTSSSLVTYQLPANQSIGLLDNNEWDTNYGDASVSTLFLDSAPVIWDTGGSGIGNDVVDTLGSFNSVNRGGLGDVYCGLITEANDGGSVDAVGSVGLQHISIGYEPDGDPTGTASIEGVANASGWYSTPQTVRVQVGNVSEGDDAQVSCITPTGAIYTTQATFDVPETPTTPGPVDIPATDSINGANNYSCVAQNLAGETSAPFTTSFNVDDQDPAGNINDQVSLDSGNLLSSSIPNSDWGGAGVNYNGAEDYSVSLGASGLASGSCTVTDTDTDTYPGSGITDPDAGQSTTYQLTGADALQPPVGVTNPASGAGTYQFDVPLYQGQNSVQCSTTNGAGSASPTYTSTPLVDSVMPSIAFTGSTGTYTNGNTLWINSPSGTIDLTALAGASGLASSLSGAQVGTGPAEDPNDDSIDCTPSGNSVQVGSPVSTSLLTAANLTSDQVAAGFDTGVQDVYQPSGAGVTTLECVSMNGAGVYQNAPITQHVGIDATVPVTTLSDTASVSSSADDWTDDWQASAPAITVDASTTGASGIANVICTVNGDPVAVTAASGNPASGAGSYEYTVPASVLANGPNVVSCESQSGADLMSAADSQTLNLDQAQPTIAAQNLPASGWQTSQDVSFSATSGPSGIASVICSVDGGPAQTYTSPVGTTTWSVGVPLGGNGQHSVDCQVVNGAGVSIDSGAVAIGADNQTPGITWTGVPTSQWVAASVPVQITGTAGPSGVKSVSCQLDGGAWNTTNGDRATVSVTTSGPHTIECYSASVSGLTSPVQSQTVQVDTVEPAESFSGAAAGTWLTDSPNQSVTVNATAGPSGVQSIDCTVDGVAQALVNPSNEQYNSSTSTYSTAAAFAITGNGQHVISCRTLNGAQAATATQTETIDVDASTPSIQLTDGGQPLSAGWVSGPQTITAAAVVGPSGVSQTANDNEGGLECSVDGGAEQITTSSSEQIQVSGDGSHSVACGVEDAANVSYSLPAQTLQIDSVVPSVALSGATFGTWVKTNQVVTVEAQAGQSGVTPPLCYVNGQSVTLTPVTGGGAAPSPSAGYASAAAWTFPVNGTGDHSTQCDEASGSGLTASTQVEQVQISEPDGTDSGSNPGQLTQYGSTPSIDNGGEPYTSGPSQTTWSNGPQTVTITATPPSGAAPITEIDCTGAAGLVGDGKYPANASNETPGGGEQVNVTVADPGGDLQCTATDAAGNTYQLGSYDFLVDSHAPTGQVLPEAQWPEPNDIAISVSDGTNGSGVKSVDVTLSGKGLSDTIPTTYDKTSGDWIAVVNDGAIHSGSYGLTVKATDNAGNTGAIAIQALKLPLRASTSLTVSAGFSAKSKNKTKAAGGKPARANAAGCKMLRARAKTKAAKTRGACSAGSRKKSSNITLRKGVLSTPFGQPVKVDGTLVNDKTKKAIAHAELVVTGLAAGGGTARPIAKISTNAKGGYTYTLPAGESRTVTVAYAGSGTELGATASFNQKVAGKVTAKIAADLHAGKTAVLTGKVAGGYVPKAGVQIRIQYQIPGHTRGWSLFRAAHTTRTGRFAVRFPVSKGARGYTYKLRVAIPTQSGWPFQSTNSTTLTRTIGK